MIRLYRAHWSTNCERVALALAHKGLEAESVLISYSDRTTVERVSGQGLVPVIEDADEVVFDSIAILRRLERRAPEPPLFPGHPGRGAELDAFCEWFERVWKAPPDAIEDELATGAPDLEVVAVSAELLQHRLGLFERLLEGRDYMFGDELSAADFYVFPFLKYARGRDPADDELFHRVLDEHQSLEGLPRLAAWIDRVDALPRAYGESVTPS